MFRQLTIINNNKKPYNQKLSWKADSKVKSTSWENINYKPILDANRPDDFNEYLFKVYNIKLFRFS